MKKNTVLKKEIKALVKKHKSYGKAALATGIKKPTLYAWARGWRKPDADDLDSVAEKTGIPKEKLRADIFGKAA